ncbi:MAG TPA: 50S ribosomal protein L22, partial [Candidatus Methylacidiphilales bacterium]
ERLEFYPKKAARIVFKTLHSAIANAENNNNLDRAGLIVKEAIVGEGPTFKRFQPKARGSAGPIRKRTSHVRIVLEEGETKVAQAKAKKAAAKAAKAPKAKADKKAE